MAMYEYITNEGYRLLQRMLMGEVQIDFTRIEMGDGYAKETDLKKVTELSSVVVSLAVESVVKQEDNTISISTLFSNEKMEKGFYFREKGVYAKGLDGSGTEEEILFSYANAGDAANYIDPPTVELVEKKIITHCTQCQRTTEPINIVVKEETYVTWNEFEELSNNVLITFSEASELGKLKSGTKLNVLFGQIAKAVTSLITHLQDKNNPHGVTKSQVGLGKVDNTADSDKPVSTEQANAISDAKKAGTDAQANLTKHTGNKENPHGVTKSQVGLGSVPNVATNDQTPTFSVASTRANIASGEKLSVIMGKIMKFFSDLKAHAFKDLVNNLTTSTTGSALDASQGKILKDEVDGVNRNLDYNASRNMFDGKFEQGNGNSNITIRVRSVRWIKVQKDKQYTISVKNIGSFRYFVSVTSASKFPSSSALEVYDSGWCTGTHTFTSPIDGYVYIGVARVNNTDLTPSDISNLKFQFERGSVATEYEEYRGDSNEILTEEVNGQNASLVLQGLSNMNDGTWIQGITNSEGGIKPDTTAVTTNKKNCSSGDLITVKTEKTFEWFIVTCVDSSGIVTLRKNNSGNLNINEFSVTAPANTVGFYISLQTTNTSVTPQNVGNVFIGVNNEIDVLKNDLSTHTHNYAGSDTPGGSATYALQANKDGAGNVIDATYINKTYMRNYGAGSIAFGNNMFIGIFNGDIICSSDGQEWEVNFEPNLFSLLDNDEILLGITYGNEKFVSFSNKGCSYVSSDNGNTWTKTQTIITV